MRLKRSFWTITESANYTLIVSMEGWRCEGLLFTLKRGPNILYLDSENAPNIAAVWGIHDQRISYKDIVHEWFLLSGQYSWNDSKKVNTVSILDDPKRFKKNFRDDYHVVKTLRDVISEADIVVGHNVKGHDLKKIQAKIIEYKLPPLKMPLIVDTYTWSKTFGFTSRKLGDLCSKLDLTQKLSHAPGMFLLAAMGDADAIRKIVKYGIGDVPTVRELYYRLRPYAPAHPNMNLWRGNGVECCPHCSSTEFKKDGNRYTTVGTFQSFKCLDSNCGKYFQSGKSTKRVKMR